MGWRFVDFLAESGVASSKGDARRSIQGGGVYLNNVRIEDPEERVTLSGCPGRWFPRGSKGKEKLPSDENTGNLIPARRANPRNFRKNRRPPPVTSGGGPSRFGMNPSGSPLGEVRTCPWTSPQRCSICA